MRFTTHQLLLSDIAVDSLWFIVRGRLLRFSLQ